MALVEWDKSMSVGVEKIDEQHRSLIDILNELHAAIEAGAIAKPSAASSNA